MQRRPVQKHRWGVILAGGDGARLQPVTQLISGDNRPKQFCCLLGGRTLLAHTRQRIARSISQNQTLFVLVRSHEHFYADELTDVSSDRMIVQPSNRGTLPAILCSLLHIIRVDEQAVVAFFPSDHYYADEENFRAGIDFALGAAETDSQSVILLGTPAIRAETGYGWIEAAAAISTDAHNGLLRVKQFWEKPSLKIAKELLSRGCVWNTFVMVGQARAFLNMIRSGATELYRAFEPLNAQRGNMTVSARYERLAAADFSGLVLSTTPERLRVLCLGDVGWSDLGDPNRLIEVLSRTGEESDWVAHWHRRTMCAAVSRDCNALDLRRQSAGAVG